MSRSCKKVHPKFTVEKVGFNQYQINFQNYRVINDYARVTFTPRPNLIKEKMSATHRRECSTYGCYWVNHVYKPTATYKSVEASVNSNNFCESSNKAIDRLL